MPTETTKASEQDRLAARFEPQPLPDGGTIQLISVRPWWGPKAASMTAEERAKALNDAMDQKGIISEHFVDINREPQDVREWLKELGHG